MMPNRQTKKPLSEEDLKVLKEHWEWGGGYAILWVLFTILIFGGAHFLFDYLGADDRVRILAFIMLATLVLVNAIWRAAGALAARIDLANRARHPSEGSRIQSEERER